MLIGVDFDNTIVCYDQVFHQVSLEQGLIPVDLPAGKGTVRDYLRKVGLEETWIYLQGLVYGKRLLDAVPFPGVLNFFSRCRQQRVDVCIISHKTRYPYRGPHYDLHQAAQEWLAAKRFFDPNFLGLSPTQVYFELTKQEKLQRIATVGCSHFIDDLPEFLLETNFPTGVMRILFDPNHRHLEGNNLQHRSSWLEIEELIF